MSKTLDLNGIKNLYKKGIQHAKTKYSTLFFDRNDELIEYQCQLIDKAKSLTEVMYVISMINPTFDNAFWTPEPICAGCELQKTGIQFGYASTGWYFFYAVIGPWCYNLSIFRNEIAPPDVVEFQDRNEAVRWVILGGYGRVGGEWYSLTDEYIYMKYSEPTYSTFSLSGQGQTKQISLVSSNPMQFQIHLSFTDTNGKQHDIKSQLISRTPPTENIPGSYGRGVSNFAQRITMYYSYTDMDVNFQTSADNGVVHSGGRGWIDHQLLKVGQSDSVYANALLGVAEALQPKKSRGWLWFAIQDDESGLQYMFTYFYPRTKFYSEAVQKGTTITAKEIPLLNVYKQGVPYYQPTEVGMEASMTKVTVLETFNHQGVELPTTYRITLPGGKVVILTRASAPNIYSAPHAPYESPALLYDETGKRMIGVGLIESNFYWDNDTFAKRMIAFAGGDPNNKREVDIVKNGLVVPQSGWQKTLSFIIAMGPLFLILALVGFTMYKRDQRHTRLMISIVILIMAYAVSLK